MRDEEKRDLAEDIVQIAGRGVTFLTVTRVLGDHLTSERVELSEDEFTATARELMDLIHGADITVTLPPGGMPRST